MSLDKAIMYGKERRRPYRKAKAIDPSCRNHGDNDWSIEGRLHKYKKRQLTAEEQLEELELEWDKQAEKNEDLAREDIVGEWEDRSQEENWEWYQEQKKLEKKK